jgi:hypothetical protein
MRVGESMLRSDYVVTSIKIGLSVALVFFLSNWVVRVLGIEPPVSLVDPDQSGRSNGATFIEVDGVLLWHWTSEGSLVRDGDCSSEGTFDVIVASDSILWQPEENYWESRFMARLRRRLAPHKACVVDVSAPGYYPYQQLKGAQLGHEKHGGDLLVFVVWKPSNTYSRLGDRWWDIDIYERDEQGYPHPLIPVWKPLHHWLFDHNNLWAFATLEWQEGSVWVDDVSDYIRMLEWAKAEGVPVIMVEGTYLTDNMSFDELSLERDTLEGFDFYRKAEAAGQQFGATYVKLAELLREYSPEEVRQDSVCHYNSRGHELIDITLGSMIEEIVLEQGSTLEQ